MSDMPLPEVVYNYNGPHGDEWLVKGSPRNAAVRQIHWEHPSNLYCWECSARTCEHVNAVWKWMEKHGWFEEASDE